VSVAQVRRAADIFPRNLKNSLNPQEFGRTAIHACVSNLSAISAKTAPNPVEQGTDRAKG
jgi:hypothetical protein